MNPTNMPALGRKIGFLGCLLLAGCAALAACEPAEREITLTVLDSGTQCGGPADGAGAEWIGRPDRLRQMPKRPAMPGSSQEYPWDPQVEGLLWIHMGTQPTGGYRLELAAPTAQVRNGVAVVQVRWREPAPGSFVTQALTSPCLLLKMPKAGIKRVDIKDQNDRLRLQVAPK